MRKQCLDRRIGDHQMLIDELAAWEADRNAAGATITWLFDLERARKKLGRSYPDLTTDDPGTAQELTAK